MTLPSPHFENKTTKASSEVKTRVEELELVKKGETHFVAYCKYCREGFSGENELYQHRKAHERCPFEDCKFNANAKVIAEHIQRVHVQKGNALVKIQDLTTPEQIEKWKEERRKRFPTTANVLLRQQAQEERFQRGEKLQERQKRFGDFQQRDHIRNLDKRQPQRGDHNNSNRKRHHTNRDRRQRPERNQPQNDSPEVPAKIARVEEKTEEIRKPPPPVVKPLQIQIDDSSDDEKVSTPQFKGTSQMKDYHKVETLVKEHAALSILGMYGSDSESEVDETTVEKIVFHEDTKEEINIEKELSQENPNMNDIKISPEDSKQSDNEAPEEVPIEHTTTESPGISTVIERRNRKFKHDGPQVARRDMKMKPRTVLDYSKLRKPSANPFLEKLLQDDIRHERNMLLQCVNYVVKNNFFGVGQAVKTPEAVAESKQVGDETKETFEINENL